MVPMIWNFLRFFLMVFHIGRKGLHVARRTPNELGVMFTQVCVGELGHDPVGFFVTRGSYPKWYPVEGILTIVQPVGGLQSSD